MSYYLTTQGMRIVETNDRGNITYQREYVRGEEVDVSHIDDARVEALVESGDLSEKDPNEQPAALDEGQTTRAAAMSGPVGAEAVNAAGNPVTPTGVPGEGSDLEANQVDEASATRTDEGHVVDKYDGMDRSELQQEAKNADINANQSADALRAALRRRQSQD